MIDCTRCPHVLMDYADGYGGGFWFPEGCELDKTPEECEDYEAEEDND